MMTDIDEANYEIIFLWRKHEPKQSISIVSLMDEPIPTDWMN